MNSCQGNGSRLIWCNESNGGGCKLVLGQIKFEQELGLSKHQPVVQAQLLVHFLLFSLRLAIHFRQRVQQQLLLFLIGLGNVPQTDLTGAGASGP